MLGKKIKKGVCPILYVNFEFYTSRAKSLLHASKRKTIVWVLSENFTVFIYSTWNFPLSSICEKLKESVYVHTGWCKILLCHENDSPSNSLSKSQTTCWQK